MFGCLANRLKQSRRLAKENNIYFFARLLKKDAIPQILEYNIRPEQVIARQSKIQSDSELALLDRSKSLGEQKLRKQRYVQKLEALYAANKYQEARMIWEEEKEKYWQKLFYWDQEYLQSWEDFSTMKTDFEFKFRRYEDMANNIENALRFYKHFRLVNGERIVKVMKLYDRLFLVNLLEDRKRISNYFLGEEMASLHEENIKLYRGVALLKREEYNVTENRWRQMVSSTLYTQSLVYSIIGLQKEALETIGNLMNNPNCTIDQRDVSTIFLMTVVATIGFRAQEQTAEKGQKDNELLTAYLERTICPKSQAVKPMTVSEWQSIHLTPSQSQKVLNHWLKYRYAKRAQWSSYKYRQIKPCFRVLYLIAQNYYLAGQEEEASRIVKRIDEIIQQQRNITQRRNLSEDILLLIKYFEVVRCYDQQKTDKIIKIYKEDMSQFDPENTHFSVLYDHAGPEMDLVRSNMYQIALKCFQALGDTQFDEQELAIKIFQSILNVHQQMDEDIDPIKKEELAKLERRPIAHYYFNLPYQQQFKVNWRQFLTRHCK